MMIRIMKCLTSITLIIATVKAYGEDIPGARYLTKYYVMEDYNCFIDDDMKYLVKSKVKHCFMYGDSIPKICDSSEMFCIQLPLSRGRFLHSEYVFCYNLGCTVYCYEKLSKSVMPLCDFLNRYYISKDTCYNMFSVANSLAVENALRRYINTLESMNKEQLQVEYNYYDEIIKNRTSEEIEYYFPYFDHFIQFDSIQKKVISETCVIEESKSPRGQFGFPGIVRVFVGFSPIYLRDKFVVNSFIVEKKTQIIEYFIEAEPWMLEMDNEMYR